MYPLRQERFREESGFTQSGFARLVEWLDAGLGSRGEAYLEVRRRLVAYFDRRNRPAAEELAAETLLRIAKTLEETGAIAIRPPARYCYVVARLVLLDDVGRNGAQVPMAGPQLDLVPPRHIMAPGSDPGMPASQQRVDCFDRCLQQLPADERDLAADYFRDAGRGRIERRRELAQRLAMTTDALDARACRIRDAFVRCVESCRRTR